MRTRSDLVTDLFGTVGRFRRQVRRTGRGFDESGLTESQAELLRLVGRRPDVSVSEAAAELGLAPNTASTLVSKLSAAGLLVRTCDPADRRVGRLRLTDSAQRVADASKAARRAALAGALDQLDSEDVAALRGGLEVLAKLTRLLQEDSP
ncbi:MarR family winged helix-turn-helix transcriptional regulator [Mycolicibacterium palauense]|uniref:MarR family winged helix-turn-helix transcriptional regulator n=1 Tax=Mycolicibacterium palauense TaxID=2034511 RepID=UPI000BFF186D|nr:MarR family transcriptional regulator [Mycolicibacterium palauense]